MKLSKIILPVVLIGVTFIAWISFFSGTLGTVSQYNDCIAAAEDSVEKGLYEQAVEYYRESLKYKNTSDTYYSIKDAFELYYAEEHTAFVRGIYSEAMYEASAAYPENADFWEKNVSLAMEVEDFDEAYSMVKSARKSGVDTEYINETYSTLLYMVEADYNIYTDFVTSLNGYITVYDGEAYTVLNNVGTPLRSRYTFAGPINENGKGMYVNSVDARILDSYEVARARFDVELEDAGYFNDALGIVPVNTNGVWRYMTFAGEILPGEYEIAAGFYNDTTVAYDGNAWYTVASDGSAEKLDGIEDVKLDLDGCFGRSDVIVAKKDGKYGLYDTSFAPLCDFTAEDMDICIDGNLIAFKKDGKWGFVDSEGNVKLEPKFDGAKSFANGYAAVCNEEGKWGFVKDDFETVIDYSFLDAYYFTSSETCPVSLSEGTMQLISFVFD